MTKKLIYGILICVANLCYAVPPDWVNITSQTVTVFSFGPSFLRVDGMNQTFKKGDAIGIFVKNGSSYECVGYKLIDSLTSQSFIDTAHFGGINGYDFGQTPVFRYYSAAKNCQYVFTTDSAFTLDNGYHTVSLGVASTSDVSYSNNTFMVGMGVVFPTYKDGITILFYGNNGLDIDSSSGAINLNNAIPNSYAINFSTNFCLTAYSTSITITDSLKADTSKIDISNLKYDFLPATCEQKGSILIKSSSINGKQPFTYNLTNKTDNSLLTNGSGLFSEVKEGIYTLSVSDSAGKTATYSSAITISKVGDCYNTVLRPDGKDGIQTLYIPDVGHAKILNRDGEVIKQLSIPAEWDCNDAQGKPVPMGDYYLFINEIQSKVITVLR